MTPLIWFMGRLDLRATAEALPVRRIADGRRVGLGGWRPTRISRAATPHPDDEH
jgi:hypothetical protein